MPMFGTSLKNKTLSAAQDILERAARGARDSGFYTITPADAAELMANVRQHQKQRDKQSRRVDTYAESLKKTGPIYTGDTLKFDIHGFMIDGQHRLPAIVLSGVSLETLVAFGCGEEAFMLIDAPVSTRRKNEVLKMAGVPNWNPAAAALQLLIDMKGTAYTTRFYTATAEQLLARYDNSHFRRSLFNDLVSRSDRVYRTTDIMGARMAAIGYVAAINGQGDRVNRVFTALGDGNLVAEFKPFGNYCKFITVWRAKNPGSSIGRHYMMLMLIQAWNLHSEGRKGTTASFVDLPTPLEIKM